MCIQIPRLFPWRKISLLESVGMVAHISGVMLYQLSYDSPGSKVMGVVVVVCVCVCVCVGGGGAVYKMLVVSCQITLDGQLYGHL